MRQEYEAAKYLRKWAVFGKTSQTFTDIGKSKRFCEKKAKELNEYCHQKDLEEKQWK